MKPMAWWSRVALGLALSTWVGCATLSRSGGVSTNVVNVTLSQASLLETSAALTLRLINETPEPLRLSGGAHRLYVNESFVGRAVSNEPLTIPPLGTATQTITVYLENLTLLRKLTELSQSTAPRMAYRLESKLHPADRGAFGRVNAIATGELDLSALQQPFAVPGPASR